MKLKDLLNVIDISQFFTLFKGEKIGFFVKTDLGIEPYLEKKVWEIKFENEELEIMLEY